MKQQVDKKHYDFKTYVDLPRWNSYYYQISEATKSSGKDVLYIGAGDGIVVDVLKKFGKDVKTLDFATDLNPDYVGSVTDIESVLGKDKNKFDVIVCSQVLEHIPFDMFEPTIRQLADCVNDRLVLSLPNSNWWVKIRLPIFGEFAIRIKRIMRRPYTIDSYGNGEHYWEIDARGCPSRKDIKKIVEKYFKLEKMFVPFNNTYHVFYILKKK